VPRGTRPARPRELGVPRVPHGATALAEPRRDAADPDLLGGAGRRPELEEMPEPALSGPRRSCTRARRSRGARRSRRSGSRRRRAPQRRMDRHQQPTVMTSRATDATWPMSEPVEVVQQETPDRGGAGGGRGTPAARGARRSPRSPAGARRAPRARSSRGRGSASRRACRSSAGATARRRPPRARRRPRDERDRPRDDAVAEQLQPQRPNASGSAATRSARTTTSSSRGSVR
jgi:hypothetical protein